MPIPDIAFEAAGKAVGEHFTRDIRLDWSTIIVKAVEAAAPHIKREAWAEGYEDGVIDGDPAIQSKFDRGLAQETPNPYGA